MKKIFTIFLICIFFASTMALTGCGDKKTIDGITYDTYGYFNASTNKNPEIQYRIIIGNVLWSLILFESIVFPVYFIGFSLWEPIGKKSDFIPGESV